MGDKSDRRRASSPPRSTFPTDSSPMNSPPRRFSSPTSSRASNSSDMISSRTTIYSDRFIPSRASSNLEDAFELMENSESPIKKSSNSDPSQKQRGIMNSLLRSELLGQPLPTYRGEIESSVYLDGLLASPNEASRPVANVLKFNSPKIRKSSGGTGLSVLESSSVHFSPVPQTGPRLSASPKKTVRKISRLQDDYYLNLVDWSSNNVLAVALGTSVFLWSACTSKVISMCDLRPDDQVTSITWAQRDTQIAVGTLNGHVQIWDAVRCVKLRDAKVHNSRVGTLAWSSTLLASGSRDRVIALQDIRIRHGGSSSGSSSSGASATASPGNSPARHSAPFNMGSSGSSSSGVGMGRDSASSSTEARHAWMGPGEGPDFSLSSSFSMIDGFAEGSLLGGDSGGGGGGSGSSSSSSSVGLSRSHISAGVSVLDNYPGIHDTGLRPGSAEGTRVVAGIGSGPRDAVLRQSILRFGSIGPSFNEFTFDTGPGVQPDAAGVATASGAMGESSADAPPRGLFSPGRSSSGLAGATSSRGAGAPGAAWGAGHGLGSPARPGGVFGVLPGASSSSSGGSHSIITNPSIVQELTAHRQEVCGLKWSNDERMLASGGNDNKLFVWSPQVGGRRDPEPTWRFSDHIAAVKAVAWSPHQHGLLASGGGTADRHIRFWNALTGAPLHRIDTGSQVCNLMWSKTVNEIVSTHGYSLNQVIVWKYPSMQKIATLTGHTLRVLYLAMSPDGQSIVTGAGDETLRFWNVFPGPRSGIGMRIGPSTLVPSGQDIR